MPPFVSVIIPTYNRERTISRAIESVIGQTYHNWELIIIDDASTDNTDEIVKEYLRNDERIQYIKGKRNKGANARRNQGIKRSKGEFVAFLDSDNYWDKTKLEKQIMLLQEERDADICFCKVRIVNGKREMIVPDQKIDYKCLGNILKRRNVVDTSTLLLKKKVLVESNGFDENMPRLQDYELIFRLVNKFKYKVAYIDEILDTNVMQDNSITKNLELTIVGEKLFFEKNRDFFSREEVARWVCENHDIINMDDDTKRRAILQYMADDPEVLVCLTDNIIKQTIKGKESLKFLSEWIDADWIGISGKLKSKNIAIYGIGRWGKRLLAELKKNNVEVRTVIDREVILYGDVNIIKPDEFCTGIEAIIISVLGEGESIREELRKMYTCEIVTLKELLEW